MPDTGAIDDSSSIAKLKHNFPKVFFSYSREDSAFVLDLANRLRIEGIDLWLDQFDIPTGVAWDNAVEQALKSCPAFLVVLSPSSVVSTHVMDEVAYALDRHKMVIPVLASACEIPFRLSRLQYVDFTVNNGHAVEKLLSVLRKEPQTANNMAQTPIQQMTSIPPTEAVALNNAAESRIRLIKGGVLGFIISFFVYIFVISHGDADSTNSQGGDGVIGVIAILWSLAGAAIGVNSTSWQRLLWPVGGAALLFIFFTAPKFQWDAVMMSTVFSLPAGAILGAIVRSLLFI